MCIKNASKINCGIIGEYQCGHGSVKDCAEQVFVLREADEKSMWHFGNQRSV